MKVFCEIFLVFCLVYYITFLYVVYISIVLYEIHIAIIVPISEIWDEFLKWIDTIHASDGSRLDKAINYTKNQEPYLMNYLLDERIPISNNFAENSARPYAVGRKNFLFHNSTDGAETSAIIYSLVESAKRNELNVMKYLETVLTEMMDYNNEPLYHFTLPKAA